MGDDKVFPRDSLRYVDRTVAAGADARVDLGEGMAHGFLSDIGTPAASIKALDEIGWFLTDRLMAFTK
jgi:monoterpene epsilon-lactone hydrolase